MALFGFDESTYQAGLDPAQVPGDFVHIKCTGGDGYENPYWRQQLAAAKAAGKRTSLYHFARDGYTNATAASEVAWFLSKVGNVFDGTVLPVLDWEADNKTDVAYAKALLDGMTAGIGVKTVLYADYGTITSGADWSPVAAEYPCWEAAYVLGYQAIYGYQPPNGLADIPFWRNGGRVEWQFTSSGHLSGWAGALDLDMFFGSAADWDAMCARIIQPASSNITPLEDPGMSFGPTDQVFTAPDGVSKVSMQDLFNAILDDTHPIKASTDQLPSFITDVRGDLANKGAELAQILAKPTADITDAEVTSLANQLGPALIQRLAAQLQK